MLIWGSKREVVDLGRAENKRCDTCGQDRPFKIFLQYTSRHIWYIFRWVTDKQYLFLCDVCRRGVVLDTKKIEATLQNNPISWYQRYSWMILMGLILFAIAAASLESHNKSKNTQAYIEHPKVNDIYLVNTNKIAKTPSDYFYCAVKVKNVNETQAELALSTNCYNKSKGVDRDIRAGKAGADSYYAKETIFVPLSELIAWKGKEAIIDIYRF